MRKVLFVLLCLITLSLQSQELDSLKVYKKRVLESTEIDFLSSYYAQEGDNAAVSGGMGTEELTDGTGTIVVSVPLNDDDVLTINAGISAYTSASSSNVNPFDGTTASPYVASSGASSSDLWSNVNASYTHSSDDRNSIWSANASVSLEYDYFSTGVGGSYTRLLNQKNTTLGINGSIYLDDWKPVYPIELRPFSSGNGLSDLFFEDKTITGSENYNPEFYEVNKTGRNSYALGLNISQILSKRLQGSIILDLVVQKGLLSTPFQRVYFQDKEDSFIENFQLADDIERLPNSRFKTALGGRLNYYLNQAFVLRTFYRYYFDDWGIASHTASLEIPIKIGSKFTFYPSYRYYTQTAADYFAPYEMHLSTDDYYTSDYDLSNYNANQFGFGGSYTDVFTDFHILGYGLKSIDLRYAKYDRNTSFNSYILTAGIKFVAE